MDEAQTLKFLEVAHRASMIGLSLQHLLESAGHNDLARLAEVVCLDLTAAEDQMIDAMNTR